MTRCAHDTSDLTGKWMKLGSPTIQDSHERELGDHDLACTGVTSFSFQPVEQRLNYGCYVQTAGVDWRFFGGILHKEKFLHLN